MFCRMEVLKRYCSLPDYQRMCCKSCSNVTIPEPLPNSFSRSTPVTSIHPTVRAPPPTSTLSAGFTTIQPTKPLITTISASTTNYWTITHSSTPVPVPHSTPTSLSTTDMIASHPSAATSAPVVPTAFSMATTSVTTASSSITAHPLPLPVPDTDESTDPKLQSATNSPKTSGIITTIDLSAATSPTITIPAEFSTKTDSPLKSKPKKNIPPKKKPKKVFPPKINPKKNTALKNTTRKAVPPKNKSKKKTIPAPKKNTFVNRNPQNNSPEKTTAQNITPANTTPKKTSPKKTTQEKTTPKKTTPKRTTPKKTTPKKTTQERTTPKKSTPEKPPPKKTTIVKHTPEKKPKAKVPPKAGSKKTIQPKTKVTKQTQTRINNKKSPKPGPRNATDSQGPVKKTIPKKKTLVSSYSTTTRSPYSLEPSREHFSSSTSVYDPSPVPESGVNVTFISNNTAATEEPPLWFHESKDTGETTPGVLDDLAKPTGITKFDDVTMPSGTLPPGDVHMISSGDVTVTSGAILSGDDITVSYGNVGLVSDTIMLHDGLTMVIPTINSEDMTDLASTPWQDLSEYIPVSVPTTTPEPIINSPPTTIYKSTDKPAITTATSFTGKAEENRENNSIDLSYNRIVGVDNDISRNNLIPKRRVNLRERTRNKRIQELLEEKRNFLLRMKRGHAAR